MSSLKKKAISLLFENTTKETEPFKNTSTSSNKPLHLGKEQETPGRPFLCLQPHPHPSPPPPCSLLQTWLSTGFPAPALLGLQITQGNHDQGKSLSLISAAGPQV